MLRFCLLFPKFLARKTEDLPLFRMQVKYRIIHDHDWMTYPAAVAAKRISKKPLIVHIQATEFDRSGHSINRDIFNIEKMARTFRVKDLLYQK